MTATPLDSGKLSARPIFVTGAGGFIGRSLVQRLVDLGASEVTAFGQDVSDLPDGVGTAQGDILDGGDLRAALPSGALVVHLAAMNHAGLSVQEPESCFEVNALGTVRVLEACRMQDAAGVIFASTALVYGAPDFLPVTEAHPTRPLTPYAASKLAAEAAVMAYAGSYDLPALVLRFSNVYGPGGHPDAVHSVILEQLFEDGVVELLDLSAERDFVHVDDVVEGMVRALAALTRGCRAVVNLSAGVGRSVADLAEALVRAYGERTGIYPKVRQRGEGHLSSVRRMVIDNSSFRELVGWVPSADLEGGAGRTVGALLRDPEPVTHRSGSESEV